MRDCAHSVNRPRACWWGVPDVSAFTMRVIMMIFQEIERLLNCVQTAQKHYGIRHTGIILDTWTAHITQRYTQTQISWRRSQRSMSYTRFDPRSSHAWNSDLEVTRRTCTRALHARSLCVRLFRLQSTCPPSACGLARPLAPLVIDFGLRLILIFIGSSYV